MRNPSAGRRSVFIALAAALCVLAVGVGYVVVHRGTDPVEALPAPAAPTSAAPDVTAGALTFKRLADPARTEVHDAAGRLVAVFTDGARTVRLVGPSRTFRDPAFSTASVTTDAWIRLAPHAWSAADADAPWVRSWLITESADVRPDALGVAMQYLHGAPDLRDARGVRYAGDASFGPLSDIDPDGRAENSDFYDYLGIPWKFPGRPLVQPKKERYGDIDCSGFLRMVYGYRLGYPLLDTNTAGPGLPRRAYAIGSMGPGTVIVANRGTPPTDYDRLQPGDLVFFHSDPWTPMARTDHSGIFLGVDDAGHYRFISSRSKADGPTFGDMGGAAILDGGGYWAQRFRTARRI